MGMVHVKPRAVRQHEVCRSRAAQRGNVGHTFGISEGRRGIFRVVGEHRRIGGSTFQSVPPCVVERILTVKVPPGGSTGLSAVRLDQVGR